jgi:hypothetical protein
LALLGYSSLASVSNAAYQEHKLEHNRLIRRNKPHHTLKEFAMKQPVSLLHSAEQDDRDQAWRTLRDWFGMELFVKFDVGTPGQTMNVLVDSGSDWFWINSAECTTCGGRNRNKYDSGLSSTE